MFFGIEGSEVELLFIFFWLVEDECDLRYDDVIFSIIFIFFLYCVLSIKN